jgi:hypothetical protein
VGDGRRGGMGRSSWETMGRSRRKKRKKRKKRSKVRTVFVAMIC